MDGIRLKDGSLLRSAWALFVGIAILFGAQLVSASTAARVEAHSEASHFEFLGPTAWQYQLTPSKSGFTLQMRELQEKSESELRDYKDERIESIHIRRTEGEFPVQVEVHFSQSQGLEVFDYLTDDPRRLVVDVFPAQEAASKVAGEGAATSQAPQRVPAGELPIEVVAAAPAAPSVQAKAEAPALEPEPSSKAEPSGLFDAADPDYLRFQISLEDSKKALQGPSRLFLEFPIWTGSYNFLSDLLKEEPVYIIHEKPGRENLEARFLLTLFKEDRAAATIRAGEIFLRKYPRSEYRQIVEHLLGDTYLQHWLWQKKPEAFERAMALYKDLMRKNSDSPLQERTALVTALSYLQRGDGPSALRILESFKADFPESEFLPQVELALAHTDLLMNSFESALSRLASLQEPDTPAEVTAEAAHLAGNVHLKQQDWGAATKAYEEAKSSHPEGLQRFGYASFNLGEAYFRQGEYLKSLEAFRQYALTFPDSEMAAFALTRIGEIFEVLDQPIEKALAVYRESHFRFRETDGGKLSRVRLIANTMKNMGDKEIQAALKELESIAENMNHPQAQEYVEFVKAEGYRLRGDYQTSADLLIRYIARGQNLSHRDKIQESIVESLIGQMEQSLQGRDPIEALRVYGKHANLWFKSTESLEPLYLAAQAFEKAGAPEKALELYQDLETRRGKGSEISDATLWVRQAQCQCALGRYTDCEKSLKKLSDPALLSAPEKVEVALLAATVFEKKGRTQDVARVLNDLKGESGQVALSHPAVLLQLARAHSSAQQYQEAESYYQSYLDQIGLAQGPAVKEVLTAYSEFSSLLAQNGKSKAAQSALEEMIQTYGDDYDLSPERYQLGKLYLQSGKAEEAQKTWQPLVGLENNIWATLAQDQLQELEWSQENQGILNRLPASQRN